MQHVLIVTGDKEKQWGLRFNPTDAVDTFGNPISIEELWVLADEFYLKDFECDGEKGADIRAATLETDNYEAFRFAYDVLCESGAYNHYAIYMCDSDRIRALRRDLSWADKHLPED